MEINLSGRIIGPNSQIFLIAEAGVNHNGDIENAKKLVDIAKKAKVDAIKFQTFKTNKFVSKFTPKANYQKAQTSENENFYDMIKKYELLDDEFRELKNYCEKKQLIFLSTPFDEDSVEFLDEIGVLAFKISSGDMNNFPLIKLICSKKKPLLISTGMATFEEVKETINYIKSFNIDKIAIFQCTSNYPASYDELNLNVIEYYKKAFPGILIGFSDHSLGIIASIAAVAKGVVLIEKHITLDKNAQGPDHKASLDPLELQNWVKEIRNTEKALGDYEKKPTKYEKEILNLARKSIVCIKHLNKGEVLDKDNISIKRPAPNNSISARHYENIIGKRINKDKEMDSIIYWDDLN